MEYDSGIDEDTICIVLIQLTANNTYCTTDRYQLFTVDRSAVSNIEQHIRISEQISSFTAFCIDFVFSRQVGNTKTEGTRFPANRDCRCKGIVVPECQVVHRHATDIVRVDNTKTRWVPENRIAIVTECRECTPHSYRTYTNTEFDKGIASTSRPE